MDPMVIKYLGLAAITYGTHAFLAIAQVTLSLFLMMNGVFLLLGKTELAKWPSRFGLITSEKLGQNRLNGWVMTFTGLGLILPLLGFPYWIGIIACAASIYWVITLSRSAEDSSGRRTGSFARKGLLASAVLILGFTVWEGRDLVRAGWDVNYKAIYWRNKEVSGWQKDNNPNVPKPGEMAPDFELTDVHGAKVIRLSDFQGNRPVVLLFGSFT